MESKTETTDFIEIAPKAQIAPKAHVSPKAQIALTLQNGENNKAKARKPRRRDRSPQTVSVLRKQRRSKANDRERNRMHGLNEALEKLRKILPSYPDDPKLTKIETLRYAQEYIRILNDSLEVMKRNGGAVNGTNGIMARMVKPGCPNEFTSPPYPSNHPSGGEVIPFPSDGFCSYRYDVTNDGAFGQGQRALYFDSAAGQNAPREGPVEGEMGQVGVTCNFMLSDEGLDEFSNLTMPFMSLQEDSIIEDESAQQEGNFYQQSRLLSAANNNSNNSGQTQLPPLATISKSLQARRNVSSLMTLLDSDLLESCSQPPFSSSPPISEYVDQPEGNNWLPLTPNDTVSVAGSSPYNSPQKSLSSPDAYNPPFVPPYHAN